MKTLILIALLLALSSPAFAKDPDCTGTEQWPTVMAFVHLKNAGYTNNDKVDFSKTRTTRMASQKIGKDLYRQIHHVVFTEKSGNTIETITSNEASHEECSMSAVDVFVIRQHLGGEIHPSFFPDSLYK